LASSARPGLGLGPAFFQHGERPFHDVLQHRHVREQVEVLKHHAGARPEGGQRLVSGQNRGLAAERQRLFTHADFAAIRHGEQVHAAQQGGLARTGRADQRHHRAALHRQIDALEHGQIAERLFQALDLDDRRRAHAHASLSSAWPCSMRLAHSVAGSRITKYATAMKV
jgi:hypothetical protein